MENSTTLTSCSHVRSTNEEIWLLVTHKPVEFEKYLVEVRDFKKIVWSVGLFSKNRLLEVVLTQIHETVALRTLTTVDVFF